MYLIKRIEEYQLRYETETYTPELEKLLNTIKEFLKLNNGRV